MRASCRVSMSSLHIIVVIVIYALTINVPHASAFFFGTGQMSPPSCCTCVTPPCAASCTGGCFGGLGGFGGGGFGSGGGGLGGSGGYSGSSNNNYNQGYAGANSNPLAALFQLPAPQPTYPIDAGTPAAAPTLPTLEAPPSPPLYISNAPVSTNAASYANAAAPAPQTIGELPPSPSYASVSSSPQQIDNQQQSTYSGSLPPEPPPVAAAESSSSSAYGESQQEHSWQPYQTPSNAPEPQQVTPSLRSYLDIDTPAAVSQPPPPPPEQQQQPVEQPYEAPIAESAPIEAATWAPTPATFYSETIGTPPPPPPAESTPSHDYLAQQLSGGSNDNNNPRECGRSQLSACSYQPPPPLKCQHFRTLHSRH